MRLSLLVDYGVILLTAAACSGKSIETITPDGSVPLDASTLLDASALRVAEGNATLNFLTCALDQAGIFGAAGPPTTSDHGGTVSDGSGVGYRVSCYVTRKGTYTVSAHVESPDMALDVSSSDVNAGAQMTFFTGGIHGTQDAMTSVDATNNPAASCTLTVAGGSLQVSSGTIFAQYDCPNVKDPLNLASECHTQGLFYFTGCDS